jgi:hypothetical protein
LIVLAIGSAIGLAAEDDTQEVLIIGAFVLLGILGWATNYEELRDDEVYTSSAAGIHGVIASTIRYELIVGISKGDFPRDVWIECSENGVVTKHKVWVPPNERHEFIADLVARIEARTGRRIEVSEGYCGRE